MFLGDLQRQQDIHTVTTKIKHYLKQVFFIKQIIAKKSNSFTGGGNVKECMIKATDIPCPKEKKTF